MPGKDGMECQAFCPTKCGAEDMVCPGGQDWNGCQMPDMCMPSKGKQYQLNYLVPMFIIFGVFIL